MPAAAVIPAPIVYIKAVAVKKLVVGIQGLKIMWWGWVDIEEASVFGGRKVIECWCFFFFACPHHVGLLFTGRAGDFKSFIHRFSSVK